MYLPAYASINSEDKFAILSKGIEANFPPIVKIVGHSILKFLYSPSPFTNTEIWLSRNMISLPS